MTTTNTDGHTTKLLIDNDKQQYWPKLGADDLTLQIDDPIGYNASGRTIISATVSGVDLVDNWFQFSAADDDYNLQVLGSIRSDFSSSNPNSNIYNSSVPHKVQPFDTMKFPDDGAIHADLRNKEFVIAKVDKSVVASVAVDIVALFDNFGNIVTIPAAHGTTGKSVTFYSNARVWPENYTLYYVNQTSGVHTSIPKPTGDPATDHYSIDCVSGAIVLSAVHVAWRPATTRYCYVLKYVGFDLVNRIKVSDIVEARTCIENMQAFTGGASLTSQNYTVSKTLMNFTNLEWQQLMSVWSSNHILDEYQADETILSGPLVSAWSSPPADYGYILWSADAYQPGGGARWGKNVTLTVKTPILVPSSRDFENIPFGSTIIEAYIRIKPTDLGSVHNYWSSYDQAEGSPVWITGGTISGPTLTAGYTFLKDPAQAWCVHHCLDYLPEASGTGCSLRGGRTVQLFGPSPDGWGYACAIALGSAWTPIQRLGHPQMKEWFWESGRSVSGGWEGNCIYQPPQAPASSKWKTYQRDWEKAIDNWDGSHTEIEDPLDAETLFADYCRSKAGSTVLPNAGAGCTCTHFSAFDWTGPRSGAGSVNIDGTWQLLDIADLVQAWIDNKNSLPGTMGIALGQGPMAKWGDIDEAMLPVQELNYTSAATGGNVDHMARNFQNHVYQMSLSIELGNMYIKFKLPADFQPHQIPFDNYAGITV